MFKCSIVKINFISDLRMDEKKQDKIFQNLAFRDITQCFSTGVTRNPEYESDLTGFPENTIKRN